MTPWLKGTRNRETGHWWANRESSVCICGTKWEKRGKAGKKEYECECLLAFCPRVRRPVTLCLLNQRQGTAITFLREWGSFHYLAIALSSQCSMLKSVNIPWVTHKTTDVTWKGCIEQVDFPKHWENRKDHYIKTARQLVHTANGHMVPDPVIWPFTLV